MHNMNTQHLTIKRVLTKKHTIHDSTHTNDKTTYNGMKELVTIRTDNQRCVLWGCNEHEQ